LLAGGAAGLAVLALAFAGYLWVINDQWQSRSEALSTEAHNLGQDLSDTRQQVVDKQAEIDLLNEQLATDQARVLELATESAQAGDSASYAQQQLELYQELAALGGSVSLALNHCVDEHEKLAGYLKDSAAWDPTELAAYEAGVNKLCNSAQAANASFQKALTQ